MIAFKCAVLDELYPALMLASSSSSQSWSKIDKGYGYQRILLELLELAMPLASAVVCFAKLEYLISAPVRKPHSLKPCDGPASKHLLIHST